jgi:hypothetical protein
VHGWLRQESVRRGGGRRRAECGFQSLVRREEDPRRGHGDQGYGADALVEVAPERALGGCARAAVELLEVRRLEARLEHVEREDEEVDAHAGEGAGLSESVSPYTCLRPC